MDDDLAFCLEAFAEDQISERNEEIQQLKRRQEELVQRLQRDEQPLRGLEVEIKQKYIEKQNQAIQLAGAFRKLAVGFDNATKFDNEFRQIVNQTDQFVPVILGRIDDPTGLIQSNLILPSLFILIL